MLDPQIVGSLPKPAWLAQPHVLRAPWRLSGTELREAQDDAVRIAILEQEEAGLAVVTDGEVRRRHYIWGFLDGLTGVDTERLGQKQTRGGRYAERSEVARIVGPVERRCPVFAEACRFARRLTRRSLKVTLPGPMTIVDTVADEHYHGDRQTLAMRFAAILNQEARDLAAAGADIVQFDEPCFNIYLEDVEAWGIEALEQCMDGVPARRAVHICYGYGTPSVNAWKSRNTDWSQYHVSLPLLARSTVDQVSVECAASGVDLSVLAELKGKDVLFGAVEVATDEVESPALVADRIRAALRYVDADRLLPCTDCGLVPRSRSAARGKMLALARGAEIVRREIGEDRAPGTQTVEKHAKTVLFP